MDDQDYFVPALLGGLTALEFLTGVEANVFPFPSGLAELDLEAGDVHLVGAPSPDDG